jgi:hypothetical protein
MNAPPMRGRLNHFRGTTTATMQPAHVEEDSGVCSAEIAIRSVDGLPINSDLTCRRRGAWFWFGPPLDTGGSQYRQSRAPRGRTGRIAPPSPRYGLRSLVSLGA